MKKCTKCGIEKELSEFTKLKRSRDGLYPQCRTCKLEYWKKNREHELARNKQWKKNNTERVRESSKKWKKENPEKVKKYKAADYQKHKEKRDKSAREYLKKYPEKKKEYAKKSREKETFKEWRRAWDRAQEYHKTLEQKARKVVCYAVKNGSLTKPTTCSECQNEGKVEAHHADYEKPLEVVWLCRKCHMAKHKTKRRIENAENKEA